VSRVGLGVRLAYGVPALALAAVGIPVYVHLPKFYTDVVGVPVAALGSVVVAARLFDAVTDPAIGFLSDRTRTRWGRRRPWIVGASVPLALALLALFAPPVALAEGAALAWFAAALFAVFLFWTAVTVPYEALGPELSFDYDERTAVLAWRDGLLVVGTLAAAASPLVAASMLGADRATPDGERATFAAIGAFDGLALVATCALCSWRVGERPPRTAATGREDGAAIGGWRAILRNRPFLVLLASYTIGAFGSNLPGTLILYYVEYVLESELGDVFLLEYFVTGIVFLPLWVRAAERWGKKQAWIAAMLVNTGAFAGVFTLGAGDAAAYGALVFASGVGFGATLALPSSMQADVIDLDELVTGRRREGQYVGMWAVARKLAAALGVGVALSLLGASGYVPNQPQSEEVRTVLRLLYAGVPCLCNALAIAIALAYPIDREMHRDIRRRLDQAAA
jgi:GPH family glycoside/pentoside/hexuronide:cation symporter